MNSAVERAIDCIWERYMEPLTLSDIAQSAILSRFHFSRIFKDATSVSPGRFLSAVRIYQAKRMLVATSMNVTDISFAVGYNSLGSFTNHFTDSVGVSPGRFRRISEHGGFDAPGPRPGRCPNAGAVNGTIRLPKSFATARVYVGTFSTPIVQCQPTSAEVIDVTTPSQPCPYRLPKVPEGKWFIHAVAVADNADPEPWTRRALLTGGRPSEVKVTAGCGTRATISMRPRCPTDLPILLALPDLEAEPDEFASSYEPAQLAAVGR